MEEKINQGCQDVMTLEELKRKSEVDPATVDKESLVDVKDVHIRTDLNDSERMLDYMRQIKNPYCYLDNGMVVKISFSGKKPMQECLKEYIF